MRIFSGVRPTGQIHIGNYFGAIAEWVKLINKTSINESHIGEKDTDLNYLFCIVDQHALTTGIENIYEDSLKMAAAYIACGLDTKKCSIFIQSDVPEHTELAWYLSCFAPLGWLNRMTQFKDKAGDSKEKANLGLYSYPVLMAADILLYDTTCVPVGEDQKQHVEFARDLAVSINNKLNCNLFTIPEPLVTKTGGRIMSLRDGSKKMSKSDTSDYSRICFFDTDEEIALKIKKAKTDDDVIKFDGIENRPEALNLVTILGLLTKKSVKDVCEIFNQKKFSSLKTELVSEIIKFIAPKREHIMKLLGSNMLRDILNEGKLAAKKVASKKITEIKNILFK